MIEKIEFLEFFDKVYIDNEKIVSWDESQTVFLVAEVSIVSGNGAIQLDNELFNDLIKLLKNFTSFKASIKKSNMTIDAKISLEGYSAVSKIELKSEIPDDDIVENILSIPENINEIENTVINPTVILSLLKRLKKLSDTVTFSFSEDGLIMYVSGEQTTIEVKLDNNEYSGSDITVDSDVVNDIFQALKPFNNIKLAIVEYTGGGKGLMIKFPYGWYLIKETAV